MPSTLTLRPLPVAALVGLAAVVGGWVGSSWPSSMPVPPVQAMSSLAHDTFAVCTAPVTNDAEGLFILDFETGDLTGGVLNPSTSKFGSGYRTNILRDLGFKPGKVKNPKFLLVPGQARFAGAAGNQMAPSVLYVTDVTNGVTVAYGIPVSSAPAGVSELVLLDKANPRGGKGQ